MYPDNFFMHLNSLKNPQLLIYLNCIASLSKYSPGVVKEKSRKSLNLQITCANTSVASVLDLMKLEAAF